MLEEMKLSDQLRKAIKESGMSRYRLAKEAKVSQSMLARFMVSKTGITTDTVDRIAETLGLRLEGPAATVAKDRVPASRKPNRATRKGSKD